jgi:hypothetical protein
VKNGGTDLNEEATANTANGDSCGKDDSMVKLIIYTPRLQGIKLFISY